MTAGSPCTSRSVRSRCSATSGWWGKLRAAGRADAVAFEAARAGGQPLHQGAAVSGDAIRVGGGRFGVAPATVTGPISRPVSSGPSSAEPTKSSGCSLGENSPHTHAWRPSSSCAYTSGFPAALVVPTAASKGQPSVVRGRGSLLYTRILRVVKGEVWSTGARRRAEVLRRRRSALVVRYKAGSY